MERINKLKKAIHKTLLDKSSESMTVSEDNPIKVLVVDDDELTRKLIVRLLERNTKAQVTSLSNGIEGLEYIKSHYPDLVILDLMLPGMTGFEILQKMREEELLEKHTKVILVTAKSRPEDVERGFELSADEFISKPFQPQEFIVRIKKVLNKTD
ncbi:response regulator [Fodinibius sediminis]|uniref:Response regulator receiver domain-containing protein n=1 Tax=Fodinibius sediminis TaxID=1214077 RepID=A0A521D9F2_9BACT|nr:response regulator [Fodinibius sediminis]SMO68303.1 Response regulator receiver domain-containing protein [Fodinibius sediminis]